MQAGLHVLEVVQLEHVPLASEQDRTAEELPGLDQQLAPDDLVLRLGVSHDVDPVDLGRFPFVDREAQIDRGIIGRRLPGDGRGVQIAEFSVRLVDGRHALLVFFFVERLARVDLYEAGQLFAGELRVPLEGDVPEVIPLSLVDEDLEVHPLPVLAEPERIFHDFRVPEPVLAVLLDDFLELVQQAFPPQVALFPEVLFFQVPFLAKGLLQRFFRDGHVVFDEDLAQLYLFAFVDFDPHDRVVSLHEDARTQRGEEVPFFVIGLCDVVQDALSPEGRQGLALEDARYAFEFVVLYLLVALELQAVQQRVLLDVHGQDETGGAPAGVDADVFEEAQPVQLLDRGGAVPRIVQVPRLQHGHRPDEGLIDVGVSLDAHLGDQRLLLLSVSYGGSHGCGGKNPARQDQYQEGFNVHEWLWRHG